MNGQNPQFDMAKDTLERAIKESGLPPTEFVRLGQLAEQVLSNNNMYPQLINQMIMSGVMEPDEAGQGINYQLIISLIALGRIGKEMSSSGMGVV